MTLSNSSALVKVKAMSVRETQIDQSIVRGMEGDRLPLVNKAT